PWASYYFGYPGKVTLGGFPGGARIFTLLLALPVVLVLTDVPGRRRALLASSGGALAVAAFNLLSIANDGNGLVALAWGSWLTTAAAAVLLGGVAVLPDDRSHAEGWPVMPAPVE